MTTITGGTFLILGRLHISNLLLVARCVVPARACIYLVFFGTRNNQTHNSSNIREGGGRWGKCRPRAGGGGRFWRAADHRYYICIPEKVRSVCLLCQHSVTSLSLSLSLSLCSTSRPKKVHLSLCVAIPFRCWLSNGVSATPLLTNNINCVFFITSWFDFRSLI
jgi:hypothetical protein